MPGRPPDIYPGPPPGQMGAPMPGQFQMPGQMPVMPGMVPGYGYGNPAMEMEITKARDGAQTAMILSIAGMLCCIPLSIWGLIKAQDSLRVMDTYGIQDDRSKAVAAKVIAIVGLIIHALVLMGRFVR